MKVVPLRPPREFAVGTGPVLVRHCANIELDPDEQATFVTDSGTEYDVVRKSWGYYATPSINDRLKTRGLRGVLARSESGKIYLLLVEHDREDEFHHYLQAEHMELLVWLDDGWPSV